MAAPQRYDRYGRPLPALTEAREPVTFEHERNHEERQRFARLVDDCWRIVCRRGWHGVMTLTVSVQDGMIQHDMRGGVERFYRPPRENDK